MYVYFLRSQGTPRRLKIGKAKNPIDRMKTLQTGCPYPITLAGAIRCKDDAHALRVERAMHAYFADNRKQGEWFRCTDYILSQVWDLLNQLSSIDGDVHALTADELIQLHTV